MGFTRTLGRRGADFNMVDYVLIHGTTQSPAGWDRLVAALECHGRCHAVDLPSGDTLDIDGYTSVIKDQLPTSLERPMVVAHSAAGLLLPSAARALDASRQVWVAAYVPDGRQSLVDEVAAAPTRIFNDEWPDSDPTRDRAIATYFLFHDCDLTTLRWALGTVRRFMPEIPYRRVVNLAPEIPSTYVVCERDRTIRPDWQRREASRRLQGEIVEMSAGHCPHVSMPDELAAILLARSF